MFLILDTETTGFPSWNSPSEADHQPHLVQLAMILVDSDLRERASASLIIRPEGWTIPDGVVKIHGITTETAQRFGVAEEYAAKIYSDLAFETRAQIVGHNVNFDLRIMRIALLRAGFRKERLDEIEVSKFCTMTAARPLVGLPKAPNLGECIRHFFGEELAGAHDAMNDARACLRILRHLRPAPLVAPVEDVI